MARNHHQANRGKWLETLIEWNWRRNHQALHRIKNTIKQHKGKTWREPTPFDFTGTVPSPRAMVPAVPCVFDSKQCRNGVLWAGDHGHDASLKQHQAQALQEWDKAGAMAGIIVGDTEHVFWVPIAVALESMAKTGKYRVIDGKCITLGSYSEVWDLSEVYWMHKQFSDNSAKVDYFQVSWPIER